MKFKKSLVACAVGSAMGLSASTANAQTVIGWDLQDYNNDGLSSDTSIDVPPSGSGNVQFGFKNETGCLNSATSPICDQIAFDQGAISTSSFTTGFKTAAG